MKRERAVQASLLCLAVVWLTSAAALAGDELSLTRDGKTDYVIVIPDRPSPVEQTAARELQQHLAAVTGATLPVGLSRFERHSFARPTLRIVDLDGRQLLCPQAARCSTAHQLASAPATSAAHPSHSPAGGVTGK